MWAKVRPMTKFLSFLAAWLLVVPAFAQVDCNAGMEPIDTAADFPLSARDFIKVIVANEHAIVKALGNYGYSVDIKVETLQGETVDGEFHRVSVVDFDASGARRETVADGAKNTLSRFKLSSKDISVLGDPMSFALTADSFADRDVVYSGRQKLEDHNLAIFDILPRSDKNFGRAFGGRTWVRGRDVAIVKTCGRSADYPVGDMRFEVSRAQAGGEHYFPVLTRADENVLVDEQPVRVRVTVKYSDYKAKP
jgi:hypothetical protein